MQRVACLHQLKTYQSGSLLFDCYNSEIKWCNSDNVLCIHSICFYSIIISPVYDIQYCDIFFSVLAKIRFLYHRHFSTTLMDAEAPLTLQPNPEELIYSLQWCYNDIIDMQHIQEFLFIVFVPC